MPLSMDIAQAMAREIGDSLARVLVPLLQPTSEQLIGDEITQRLTSLFQPMTEAENERMRELLSFAQNPIVDTIGLEQITVLKAGIGVYIIDPAFWRELDIIRRAVALMAFNYVPELIGLVQRANSHLRAIVTNTGDTVSVLTGIGDYLNGAIYPTMLEMLGVLESILAAIRSGIPVNITGEVLHRHVFGIDVDMDGYDLLTLLGLIGELALALAIVAGFVALLGLALRTFNANAIRAAIAVGILAAALIPLVNILKDFDWNQIGILAVGLASLAGFVFGLAYALRQLNVEILQALPNFTSLINALRELAVALSGLGSFETVGILALGLLSLAVFVGILVYAINQLNVQVLQALEPFNQLIESLRQMALTFQTFDINQVLTMGLGLLFLGIFVGILTFAVNQLDATILQALPAFTELIAVLGQLAATMASLSVEQLFMMGIAFLLMSGFVLALGAALRLAAPALQALVPIFNAINSAISSVTSVLERGLNLIDRFIDKLSEIPGGGLGGLLPSLPSFQAGGTMQTDGLAFLHAGERVLNVEETQAFEAGLFGGGGGGPVDQSTNFGDININITADRLDAESADVLSDEIVAQLQERLAALRSEQDFRVGRRATATT